MELIVVIVLFPFLTRAFVLFFATALDFTAVLAADFGLPKPTATLASPLTITSTFPSALINRGAMPPTIANHHAQHDRCLYQARETSILTWGVILSSRSRLHIWLDR